MDAPVFTLSPYARGLVGELSATTLFLLAEAYPNDLDTALNAAVAAGLTTTTEIATFAPVTLCRYRRNLPEHTCMTLEDRAPRRR
jgi:hypothetical protein